MPETPSTKRKAITALGGVVALGLLASVAIDTFSSPASAGPSNHTPVTPPEVAVIPPPPIEEPRALQPTSEVRKILQFSTQEAIQSARAKALKQQQAADKLDGNITDTGPVGSALDAIASGPTEPGFPELPQQSNLDRIVVKSLVKNGDTISGWISLDGELIPLRKGPLIADITVKRITEDSVTFSSGSNTVTRWVKRRPPLPKPKKETP